MAKMLTPEQLVTELQTHVREICDDAQRGDVEARVWLLQTFPGHVAFLRETWRPRRIKLISSPRSTRAV